MLLAIGGLLVVAGVVWPTWWLLERTSGEDGAGIANVLALPVSVLSLVTGVVSVVVGMRSRSSPDDPAMLSGAARKLVRVVAAGEATTLGRLLGDSGRPRPANLKFMQPEEALLRWRTDNGAHHGTLDNVAGYYRSLDLGRLVVLGEPGAGKTVLVLRLLLDLAAMALTTLEQDPVARVRVPIRLSLSSFVVPGDITATPGAVRARLDVWIAEHLSRVHGVPPAVAEALVADGWILPVLDGLDEMDPDHAQPQQARQVLAALNHPVGPTPGPVVLTCRHRRYYELIHPHADTQGATGAPTPVEDATAVLVQPLASEEVIAWLAHRFPDRAQPNGLQRRWQKVATTLRRHPRGRLATCLSSPLRLYLACTVYAAPDTTPARLCELDRAALDQHLLDHLVPALTRHHPRPDGSHYQPTDVTRWLTTLADHLACMARLGYSGTDLHLLLLWRTTGQFPSRRIRAQATVISALPCAVAFIGLRMFNDLITIKYLSSIPEWLMVPGTLMLILLLAWLAQHPIPDPPLRLDLSALRTPQGRRTFVFRSAVGIALGLLVGLALWPVLLLGFGLPLGFGLGLTAGIMFVLALGLALGLAVGATTVHDTAAVRPSEPLRQTFAAAIALAFAGTLAVPLGLIVGFTVEVVIVIALAVGLTVLLTVNGADAPLLWYVLAVHSLHRTGQLPWRPAQFLDWAHIAGLVRLAGIATQFRHRDLQTYFTTNPSPTASK